MTMARSTEQALHEEQLIKAFFLPDRRRRYLEFIGNPKRRGDLLRMLAHFPHLDPRYTKSLPTSQQSAAAIESLLRGKGAPDLCWVISEDDDLDGKHIEIGAVLKEILGRGIGTLISCLPGRLGYFEDEDGRFILERS